MRTMRISTSFLYSTSSSALNRQQADLLHLQEQISSGRRVLSPAEDPVASAQALEVSQANARNDQQLANQDTADGRLGSLDNQLGAVGDVIQYVRERTILAGNAALNARDRQSMAEDLKGQFEAMVSLANATDSQGEYLFSGFRGDTTAFAGNLAGMSYQGDQRQRNIQVSNSRQMPTSIAGDAVFQMSTQPGATNTSRLYGVKVTGAGTYDYYDLRADPQMTGTPAGSGSFTVGTAFNVGALTATGEEITIDAAPAVGDVFVAGSRDSFSVVSNLAYTLENLSGSTYRAALDSALGQLDNALDNVLGLRAKVGSQQQELGALRTVAEDSTVQYAQRMDQLVGVDYVSAISDFKLQQTYLEASQESFVKITGLSLFNFLS